MRTVPPTAIPEDVVDKGTEIGEVGIGLLARQVFRARGWTVVKLSTPDVGVTFATRQSGAQAGKGVSLMPDTVYDVGLVSPGTEIFAAGPEGTTVGVVATPLPFLTRWVADFMEGRSRRALLKALQTRVLVPPQTMRALARRRAV